MTADGTVQVEGIVDATISSWQNEGLLAQVVGYMATRGLVQNGMNGCFIIAHAFGKAHGVKTETARLLGIKTSALYYKLEKYGFIQKGERPEGEL